jgi:lipopolysaccharide transport system ATP-binding protein
MSLLKVGNLGKAFRTYKSEWQRFASWFGIAVKLKEEHWVLRNINFKIQSGESIGIVGQNGTGKSTLLKMIVGTLQPSEGEVEVNGRIAAILELGMGFDSELTGRQNTYHGLGLMGFSHAEIEKVLPDLESFAEIGGYFDEPVRTYSSGMQMRLAFSVATAYRPEILIVDEALSVGDAYFQHKSFNRIREFQKEGTTLLIVSHDRNAIQNLCDRAIFLENGSIAKDGIPEAVFDFYNAIIAEKENRTVKVKQLSDGKTQTTSGTGEVKVESVTLYNIAVGELVELHIFVKVCQPVESLVMGYAIKERLGQVCFGTNTWHTDQVVLNLSPGDVYKFIVRFPANFGVGSYSISIALHDKETHLTKNYGWNDLVLVFNVFNNSKNIFQGLSWLPENTNVIKIDEEHNK